MADTPRPTERERDGGNEVEGTLQHKLTLARALMALRRLPTVDGKFRVNGASPESVSVNSFAQNANIFSRTP